MGKMLINIILLFALLYSPFVQAEHVEALRTPALTEPASQKSAIITAALTSINTSAAQSNFQSPTGEQFEHQNAGQDGNTTSPDSPFDPHSLASACPPKECKAKPGHILIKLNNDQTVSQPFMTAVGADSIGVNSFTADTALNRALGLAGVQTLSPIFPNARRQASNAKIITPEGVTIPKPDLTRWFSARVPKNQDVWELAETLRKTPGITWAEPDLLREPEGVPIEPRFGSSQRPTMLPDATSDPLYVQQWHLAAANVPQAWSYLESQGLPPGGSRDIVIAVIDTGVDYTHPDLAANIWTNATELNGQPGVDDDHNGYIDDIHGADVVSHDGDPMDDHGHGTHVAGIIAAQAGNNIGGVGVAYNVQIMPIKAAQYSGVLSASDIAEAVNYAVEKGADVLNMSFGGYSRSQVEEDALAVAYGHAVLVAAAGNDSYFTDSCFPIVQPHPMFPAAYPWVIGVMASNTGGSLASFSNWDCLPNSSNEYELKAPGIDIWSTLPNNQYAAWDGTSMAAPIVSGVAALVRTKWSDKNAYSSRFIMGQIVSTIQNGVINANSALTQTPKPSLTYYSQTMLDSTGLSNANDNDKVVDAGETINLAVTINNHWGMAKNVSVNLQAIAAGAFQPDPYITMLSETVGYADVGPFSSQDNGITYDAQGNVTGITSPFRFTVAADTPNDHVIPFLITITARNGMDQNDPTVYTAQTRFELPVQRGEKLPSVISVDTTLTKDKLWLIPTATLVPSGVTLTIDPGAQLEFWSDGITSPTGLQYKAYLQVDGKLVIQGSADEPVEIFPNPLYPHLAVAISDFSWSNISIRYAKIQNPFLDGINEIDHCYFSQNNTRLAAYFDPNGYTAPTVNANIIKNSIFDHLGYKTPGYFPWMLEVQRGIVGNLFNQTLLYMHNNSYVQDNAFLLNTLQDSLDNTVIPSKFEQNGAATPGSFVRNAILNNWWYPQNIVRFTAPSGRGSPIYIDNNYWGTLSDSIISDALIDYNDDFALSRYVYTPYLNTGANSTYPFVTNVALSDSENTTLSQVGAGPVTFSVTFNRDMDSSVQPVVSFGPAEPYTDHIINGNWQNSTTWKGTFNISPVMEAGYQYLRISGARSSSDPWFITGDDKTRFRFSILPASVESLNLQATGGEGYIDLSWTQTDFDLLAGFNLYRATSLNGNYQRVNTAIIPPEVRSFRDLNVAPGQPYYYKFTVVKSDMSESDFSNTAQATPLDTIPPVLNHTLVASAQSGLPLTLTADATDNVAVKSVTLYYRNTGTQTYSSISMANVSGIRYAGTIAGSLMTPPRIDYYIEASDGISVTSNGRAENPNMILVEDRPVITAVTPNQGPAVGSTGVTISGSNFKNGATVTFGGMAASNVVVASANQITCDTPPHFPAAVDVQVTNPDGQSTLALNGFTYASSAASLSLPNVANGTGKTVTVPVNAANLKGLLSADLTITFNSSVLSIQSVKTGSLTPNWTLVSNTGTPGQVRISLVSPGGAVDGSGVLFNLDFLVIGAPSSVSALAISTVSLNGGAIPTNTAPGLFTVDTVYNVSGSVHFWNGNAYVPGATLKLIGSQIYTAISGSEGNYTVQSVPSGAYTLSPAKNSVDEATTGSSITPLDATLVLQHVVGLTTLTGPASVAADVDHLNGINGLDAYYILQKSVDLVQLPFSGAGAVWEFNPDQRSYPSLMANQTGQDFTAILLGDVSGNWTSAQSRPIIQADVSLNGTVTMALEAAKPDGNNQVAVTLKIISAPEGLSNLVFTLNYDSTKTTLLQVNLDPAVQDWLLVSNSQPGVARIALASARTLNQPGEVLHLVFQLSDVKQSVILQPTNISLDEGQRSVQLNSVTIGEEKHFVFLPYIRR